MGSGCHYLSCGSVVYIVQLTMPYSSVVIFLSDTEEVHVFVNYYSIVSNLFPSMFTVPR